MSILQGKVNKRIKICYEIFIALLALLAVTLGFLDIIGRISISDSKKLILIENSILIIFFIDYISGLLGSKSKKEYIKKHVFDLIAIIPFNSLFRAFRVVRALRAFQLSELFQVFKLLRLVAFGNKLKYEINHFLKTSGFIYISLITIAALLLGSAGIYYAERNHSINNFEDALWLTIVTASSLGYGDITPETLLGRIIASLIIFVGISFVGIYTGLITIYFIKNKGKYKAVGKKNINVTHLHDSEVDEVLKYIDFIVSRRK